MSSADTVVAKGSFFVSIDGTERLVSEGETFAADHPVVKASTEDSFGPFKVDNEIETASAKPGQKRRTRVKRDKTEEKPEPAKVEPTPAPEPTPEPTEQSSDFAKAPADTKD
jgi:hypothetical protein